jgi:hypothetical protein
LQDYAEFLHKEGKGDDVRSWYGLGETAIAWACPLG